MNIARSFLVGCFLFSFGNLAAQNTEQIVIPARVNAAAQETKPYVILISADGFRYDLAAKYHAKTLQKLSKEGVEAEYMQPSYPSLTFPNHYTLATGLYPAHSGIVDNNMYDKAKNATYSIGNRKEVGDSSWYGGIPLWVLAEQHKMLSASFYWVGSETAVAGVRPTYYYNYSEKIDIDRRISELKKWLELPKEQRPHMITFYMPEVDHAEHKYGPESKETEEAVGFVDEAIRKLTESLASLHLDINYIFVSDHGMTTVDVNNTLTLPAAVDTAKFKAVGGSTIVHLYAKDGADVTATYDALKNEAKDYQVYLASGVPAKWHYSHKDDTYNRIGDIILVPNHPKVFTLGKWPAQLGQHGYDPALPEMRATFYAWGPAFKQHQQIPGFENVHVYPLVAQILGLDYSQKIDGNLNVLKGILK